MKNMSNYANQARARKNWNVTSTHGVEKIAPKTWAVIDKAEDARVSVHSKMADAVAAATLAGTQS